MKNYRKIYEEKTGKKVPKDFDIHHIDMNRENNDISNLVAIPKILHKQIHEINFGMTINLNFSNNIFQGSNYPDFLLNEIIKWKQAHSEFLKWLVYKTYLLGEININFYNYKY